MAIQLVLKLAESGLLSFALLGFYDDDADFLSGLAERLKVTDDKAFQNKLRRVVRKLVRYGVLSAVMRGTHKEHRGEPSKQMEYSFANPGKAKLLTLGNDEYPGSPEWAAASLLRRAYPDPESF